MEPEHSPLHLFEGYGVEIEYMLCHRGTCEVLPVADRLLASLAAAALPPPPPPAGSFPSSVELPSGIEWSNELVAHVVEAKCARPTASIEALHAPWRRALLQADALLTDGDAMLVSGAAHPWMNPRRDTRLWLHEGAEIYAEYDRIFGCRTHGWANLQSVHLNLPFHGDDEFGRLHAAIRAALPLIPALAAASPYLDGAFTGWLDARMNTYLTNSLKIPAMTGPLIPEPVFCESEYRERILEPIYRQTAPLDPQGILRDEWANARGAIARFDRGAIEIRVTDSQECLLADLAIAQAIGILTRQLAEERHAPLAKLRQLDTRRLRGIFLAAARDAERTMLHDRDFASVFGATTPCSLGDIWRKMLRMSDFRQSELLSPFYDHFIAQGSLASRTLARAGRNPTRRALHDNLMSQARCLREDTFLPGVV